MSDTTPQDIRFLMLSRKFFSHPFWEEKRTYSKAEAWLDMVSMAAFAECKRLIGSTMIMVPRGGIVASVRYLSDRWKWSKCKVGTFLDLLRDEGMIRTETGQGITLILLCKYDEYNTPNRTPSGRQKDTSRTPVGHEQDEIEEDKEEEEYKEGITPTHTPVELEFGKSDENDGNVTTPKPSHMAGFDDFWKAYPKKKSKGDAEKAWKQMKASQIIDQIISALTTAKASHDWQKDSGKYIPFPATWLRRRGWEDEHEPQQTTPQKGAMSAKYGF